MMNPSPADLGSGHRAEPVPPEPHRLVTDIDAALEQDVFNLAQRQRISNIHHHRQADDLRRRVEIAERIFSRRSYEPPCSVSSPFAVTMPTAHTFGRAKPERSMSESE